MACLIIYSASLHLEHPHVEPCSCCCTELDGKCLEVSRRNPAMDGELRRALRSRLYMRNSSRLDTPQSQIEAWIRTWIPDLYAKLTAKRQKLLKLCSKEDHQQTHWQGASAVASDSRQDLCCPLAFSQDWGPEATPNSSVSPALWQARSFPSSADAGLTLLLSLQCYKVDFTNLVL